MFSFCVSRSFYANIDLFLIFQHFESGSSVLRDVYVFGIVGCNGVGKMFGEADADAKIGAV